eukprot:Gb_05656 [translate_table: standard]
MICAVLAFMADCNKGPKTREGLTTTRSKFLSLAYSHASFSATVFA